MVENAIDSVLKRTTIGLAIVLDNDPVTVKCHRSNSW